MKAAPPYAYAPRQINIVPTVQVASPAEQTVIVQSVPAPEPPRGPKIYARYKSEQSIGVGATQIIVGLATIAINIAALCIVDDQSCLGSYFSTFYIGYGIWCGAIYIIAGGLGIGAGTNRTKCAIDANMGMAICSVIFALCGQLVCGAIAVASINDECIRYQTTVLALAGTMIALALLEAILAIWSAAISGAATCAREQPAGDVQYITSVQTTRQQPVTANYLPAQQVAAPYLVASPPPPGVFVQQMDLPPYYGISQNPPKY